MATLIVNPNAGRGRVGSELPAVEAALKQHRLPYRVLVSDRTGDATRLAREALERGERFLVAVGGNGTVHRVLNGMLEDDRPVHPDAVLAVLAANSGCDVVRTFGLSQDPAEAVARFGAGQVFAIDVGKATVTDAMGTERISYFLNMAQVGLSGAAAARSATLPHGLKGSRYFLGYWLAMAGYRRPLAHLQGDHRDLEARVTNILIANLQYTANGMLVSPRSWPEDGYFDLQVFTGPKSESFTLLPKMFLGEHIPHPHVVELRSKTLGVDADRSMWVEADGIPLGRTPARFEVVQQILRFKV
jgi:YegS/Rv2252/BmrU family lipid kinase